MVGSVKQFLRLSVSISIFPHNIYVMSELHAATAYFKWHLNIEFTGDITGDMWFGVSMM